MFAVVGMEALEAVAEVERTTCLLALAHLMISMRRRMRTMRTMTTTKKCFETLMQKTSSSICGAPDGRQTDGQAERERERERDSETERQRDRQTEKQRGRKTETQQTAPGTANLGRRLWRRRLPKKAGVHQSEVQALLCPRGLEADCEGPEARS